VGKVLFPSVLHPENEEDRMPPAPSPELTDWELEVIDKWLAQPTPNR
jgi:hypothetical protein